ncbi:apolipoprotein A-IV [Astyanax mexicanus]|uniref:apolipoprotein A-IV n=1 Tax=Astyanax mexicanus TaxID=7994 RepID=UPI000BBD8575|nr:apolipoprotein A-IV [Astyanax mexicanus]
MLLQFVILAASLATATEAFPVPQDTASGEVLWTVQEEIENLASDKAERSKGFNGMWKTHVVSTDLYSPDAQNPMAAELKRKLSQESERLRARLRQELLDLRQRLSPYPSHPQLTPANIRELLAPFTQKLQRTLDSNTQELCGQLSLSLQGLQPDGPLTYREAVLKISQALDESHPKRTAAFEDFKTKAFEAVEEDHDGSKKELWEEVTARLGQEIVSFSLEVQGKVATLKVALAGLLTSAEPARTEAESKVLQFCQRSSAQNQKFIANLDQQIASLDEKHHVDPSSHVNIESIQEDFSTRLSALLADIVHTLN